MSDTDDGPDWDDFLGKKFGINLEEYQRVFLEEAMRDEHAYWSGRSAGKSTFHAHFTEEMRDDAFPPCQHRKVRAEFRLRVGGFQGRIGCAECNESVTPWLPGRRVQFNDKVFTVGAVGSRNMVFQERATLSLCRGSGRYCDAPHGCWT